MRLHRQLASSQTRLVDPVIDRVENASVEGVDLLALALRAIALGGRADVVEGRIEHTDNICGLV